MREQKKSLMNDYIDSLVPIESDSKSLARQSADELGLSRISVAPHEAQLLKVLMALGQVKKVVEIGTLTGLSALYLAEGVSFDGEIWTLEKAPEHGEKASRVFSNRLVGDLGERIPKINLVMGDAREELKKLSALGPFDAVFIDGNKAAYGDYLAWAEENVRRGGLIIADNVFLSGAVWGEETAQKFSPKQVKVLQEFNRRITNPELYQGVIIPTFEGLSVSVKLF